MKIILSILVLWIAVGIASPALAEGQIFIERNKNDALPVAPVPTTPQQPQQAPQTTQPQPALTVPQGQSTPAPEMTMDQFIQGYVANCNKAQNPMLTGEPLRMLCECTAQKVRETMTVEDVRTMATATPEGLAARNRMVVHVYGPCLEYPARAMLYYNCKSNAQILAQYPNAMQLCTCMADDMAAFMAANGPAVLAQRLIQNPNDQDPMGELMGSQAFQQLAMKSFSGCVASGGTSGGAMNPAAAVQTAPAPQPTAPTRTIMAPEKPITTTPGRAIPAQ